MKKYENFCAALSNMKEMYRYKEPYDNVVLTGLVGLYEICFEQSWKMMKEILEISGENAGVHLLLHFKTDDSEKDLIEKAAKQGVRVYGLSEYCVKDNEDSTGKAVILLGYANMNEERIRAAVQLLCKAWKQMIEEQAVF